MKNILLFAAITILFVSGCSVFKNISGSGMKTKSISIEDLSKWKLVGIGEVKINHSEKALSFTEGQGSKGTTLISPDSYGADVVSRFKVKPLQYEGVNVVFLSLSDNGRDATFPPGFDDVLDFYSKGTVSNYFVAFHNGYHKAVPFVKKNPGMTDIATAASLEKGERWYDIETGRHGSEIWLKIDGLTVAAGKDIGNGLPGGKIGLRLRAGGWDIYKSL